MLQPMSSSRHLRPEPGSGQPRMRPSDERALLAADGRRTRWIAFAAVGVAVVALGLAAWKMLTPAADSCQQVAWDTTPASKDLPAGWAITASQYDVLRKSMTLTGPQPSDATANQAVVYATITCYPEGAADSVTRSAAAAKAAGQDVTTRDDLGDQAFSAVDPSDAEFLQLRHGNVVAYLAASGDATPDDVDSLASAFDRALGGDGGEAAVGTPDAGSPGASEDLSEEPSDEADASSSPSAPELEALMPTKVGDIDLAVDSSTGDEVLSDEQGGQPIVAALRAAGATPADLRQAYAYDNAGNSDILITAITVKGMSDKQLLTFVLDTWLQAGGPGVTRSQQTISGKQVTRVDYGDGGIVHYVLPEPGVVFVVSTADKPTAEQALAALH